MTLGLLLTWASWCLTYLLHSTALLGAAWVVGRVLGMRRLSLQDLLLKGALVGGVVTATIQTTGTRPVLGDVVLAPVGAQVLPAAQIATASELAAAPSVNGSAAAPTPADASAEAVEVPRRPIPWLFLLSVAWLLVASFLVIRLVHAWTGLRVLLVDRAPLRDPVSRLILHHVQRIAGIRRRIDQSVSGRLPVPIAFGTLHPEICVPERVTHLSPDERCSIVAHELAHLVRLDPLWTLVSRAIEAVLFFQPLNRVASRRLAHLSEYLADDCAVIWTGDRRSLATSLAEVARWISPAAQLPAPAMSGSRAVLRQRIQRIVERQPSMKTSTKRFVSIPIALLGFAGLALVLPRVSSARWNDPEVHVETGAELAQDLASSDGTTVAIASDDGDDFTFVMHENGEYEADKKSKRKRKKSKRKRKKAKRRAKRRRRGSDDENSVVIEDTRVEVRGRGGDIRIYVDGKRVDPKRPRHGRQCQTFSDDGVKIVLCADGETARELQRAQRHWQQRMSELQRDWHRQSRDAHRQVERAQREHAARAAEHAQRQAERAAELAREQARRAQEHAERARERAQQARRDAKRARERALREAERSRERAQRGDGRKRGRHDL